jgi:hypothetical protein
VTKRKTGLGTDAFFQQAEPTPLEAQPVETKSAVPADNEIRERTTIMLSFQTRALLDQLKTEARRRGEKATHSAIIEAALIEYAKKRDIKA